MTKKNTNIKMKAKKKRNDRTNIFYTKNEEKKTEKQPQRKRK